MRSHLCRLGLVILSFHSVCQASYIFRTLIPMMKFYSIRFTSLNNGNQWPGLCVHFITTERDLQYLFCGTIYCARSLGKVTVKRSAQNPIM